MKDRILEKLNNLKSNDFMLNFPQKNEIIWNLALFHEDLIIKFNSVQGSPNLIDFTFEKYRAIQEISITLEQQELQAFFTILRNVIASKAYLKNCDESKRIELINLMKETKNKSFGKKEELILINGNEKKTYLFSNKDAYKYEEITIEDLSKISFYSFSISEMTKDKRLQNTSSHVEQYEILINNTEFCEIFNINIEKEKQLLFEKSFAHTFPKEIKIDNEINNISESTQEEALKVENISAKIKKIL